MRKFDYREEWKALLTPEIVSYLSQIHEFKGEQTLFIESKADTLTQLVEIAKFKVPKHRIRSKEFIRQMKG